MDLSGGYTVSSIMWVLGNIIAFSIFISASLFVILYPIFFNPNLTTAGRLIWRAILSVAGFGVLVVIGIFVDGRVEWFQMPEDIQFWRPPVRLVIYSMIAYTFASLVVLLIKRRFWPNSVQIAPEEETLSVRSRRWRS